MTSLLMTRCLLGIGSNLGDRAGQMDAALIRLREHEKINVLADSGWAETAPVGGPEKQLSYLNGAILVETDLSPNQLLKELLQVERTLGRERDLRWGPRSVDLDLLLFGEEIVDQPGLTVPHPWMAVRRFVLDPAEVVAADMVHPVIGRTIGQLAKNLHAQPLLIAVRGMVTQAQVAAVRDAAQACGAYIAAASPSSAVSDSADPLELTRAYWAATEREVTAARQAKSEQVIVFDFAWQPQEKKETNTMPVGSVLRIQPNLLIELGTERHKPHGFGGPQLFLATDDLDRLQHDVTAAIQGMQ